MKEKINLNDKYYEFADVTYDYNHIGEFPVHGATGLEKYLPLLPVEKLSASFGGIEGNTPTVILENLGKNLGFDFLYAKLEDQNPTGCFKDRESAVVISAAKNKGLKEVNIASSGNAALSTAAYSQRVGISCTCYVPEKTSKEKIILMKLFGAKVVKIPGFYEDVYKHLVDLNPPGWNVTSGQNELRTEGDKTIAFELWEQLGVPDVILVPSGNGGCLAGIWKGFKELKELNKIENLPKMVAVQVENAAPLKTALIKNKPYVILDSINDSVAEGIVALESYCSPHAVAAIKKSGGYVIEVSDSEIIYALKNIIKLESLVPEPTTAAVYAALPKLSEPANSKIVCINTGSGLKFLDEIAKLTGGQT
ncbi:MAG: pyridoxal-phosphate dependent enzyme [Patescibacteria group bacterium]